MKKSRCKKCGEKISQDDHESWIDSEDGDVCCEDDGVHEPFAYPSPDTTTIADDLQAVLYEVIEDEDGDYDDQCVYQGVEECEEHIFRAAERLGHFESLLRSAPRMLKAMRAMLEAWETEMRLAPNALAGIPEALSVHAFGVHARSEVRSILAELEPIDGDD